MTRRFPQECHTLSWSSPQHHLTTAILLMFLMSTTPNKQGEGATSQRSDTYIGAAVNLLDNCLLLVMINGWHLALQCLLRHVHGQ